MSKVCYIMLGVAIAWAVPVAAQENATFPGPTIVPSSAPIVMPQAAPLPTPVEQRLNDIEWRLSMQEQSQPIMYQGGPANSGLPNGQFASVGGPPGESPYLCGSPRSGDWTFGAEVGPSDLHLAGPFFGHFDHSGVTFDFGLGYEWATGYGIRGEFWGFGQDANDARDDTEVGAATFDIDLYKRIFVDYTELVVGAGSRAADLDFRQTSDNTHSEFTGGGIDVFGEWYHPLYIGPVYEFAFVGLGRMSLVEGDWRDKTGGALVPDTNHDMLTIFEASFGLELRRRFGELHDKYWYISVMPDIQQWQSQWMTANVGSSAGFTGTNFNFGLAW
jgi:hypothetical protein